MEEGVYESGGLSLGAEPQEPDTESPGVAQQQPEAPPWLDEYTQQFANRLQELKGQDERQDYDDFEDDPIYDDEDPEDAAGLVDPDSLDADGDELDDEDEDEEDAAFRRMLGLDDPLEELELSGEFSGEEIDRMRALEDRKAEISGRLDELEQQRLDEQYDRLMTEFPELSTEQGAAAVQHMVDQFAEEFQAPQLVENPAFARLCYLALRAEDRAYSERPVGPDQSVALEDAGAAPADPEPVHQSVFHELHADARAARANRMWR